MSCSRFIKDRKKFQQQAEMSVFWKFCVLTNWMTPYWTMWLTMLTGFRVPNSLPYDRSSCSNLGCIYLEKIRTYYKLLEVTVREWFRAYEKHQCIVIWKWNFHFMYIVMTHLHNLNDRERRHNRVVLEISN